jgi:AbrB family transcriptional regulator, transcriptional pleiotropic regulator of transition state genes
MLSAIGTARRIDALGRVVVPAEIRRLLGIKDGDLLDIHLAEGKIVMGRIEHRCTFCGGDVELRVFRDRLVCDACVAELANPAAP